MDVVAVVIVACFDYRRIALHENAYVAAVIAIFPLRSH